MDIRVAYSNQLRPAVVLPAQARRYASADPPSPPAMAGLSTPVRFMNIDCDIYSSTKTILELFTKQIVPGTVIVFDEYIGNLNWREDEFKAFQEAVFKQGWKYEYLCFSFFTNQVVVRII